MDNFVVGNMVWNAGLVGVAGLLIKKWMSGVERGREANAKAIAINDKEVREKIEAVTQQIASEIKIAIHENRIEYARQSAEINRSIKDLADHVAVANGRTAKLETKVTTQIALCQERNNGSRETCRDRLTDKMGTNGAD